MSFSAILLMVPTGMPLPPGTRPDERDISALQDSYLDKKLVAKDDANGWSFGASAEQILLGGASCDRFKADATIEVQVLFACPGMVPPPVLP